MADDETEKIPQEEREEQVDEEWENWEDLVSARSVARVGIYCGRELRAEIDRRARAAQMSTAAYVRECVKHYMRLYPDGARPDRS